MRIRLIGVLVLSIAATTAVVIAQSSQAETLLEAARRKDVVDGDPAAAIRQYEQVVERFAKTDRAAAAQALVAAAELYEKTGNPRAQSAYQRVVTEFGDQTVAAAVRSKVSARGQGGTAAQAASTGDRVVWTDAAAWGDGDVSPDGSLVSDTDYNALKFVLRDLRTNTTRVLAPWDGGASYSSTFSPDGRRLAYGWRVYGDGTRPHVNEIRLVDIDRTDRFEPRRLYGNADVDTFHPLDWSPDGKSLAVSARRADRTGEIAIVGVEDGRYRALTTFGWMGPGKIFFSPDGRYLVYDLPQADNVVERDVFLLAVNAESRHQIAHGANDVVMGWAPDGRLLFASDRSGAVGLWALPVRDGRPAGEPALLKPDIGTTSSLGTTKAGKLYLVKDASTQALYIAPIDLPAGRLSGPPVLESFRSEYPAWSRDGKVFSYARTNPSGRRVLVIRSTETGQTKEVRPALDYFRAAAWLPDRASVVTWGRDPKGRGGIYRIDAATGATTLVVESGSITNVQLSPDGRRIYYGENVFTAGTGAARFVERDLVTGQTREVFAIDRGTGGGLVSPDGRWVASVNVDRSSGRTSIVLRPVGGGEAKTIASAVRPDEYEAAISLNWTADGSVFVGKRTGDRPGLWLIPVDGRQPRELPIDVGTWGGSAVRLSPDGRQIAYFSGDSKREVYEIDLAGLKAVPGR